MVILQAARTESSSFVGGASEGDLCARRIHDRVRDALVREPHVYIILVAACLRASPPPKQMLLLLLVKQCGEDQCKEQ